MRISDWSSDVCSSELHLGHLRRIDAVVDLATLGIGDAHVAQRVVQPLASDEPGDAIAAVAEPDSGAHQPHLLPLGKDDDSRLLDTASASCREKKRHSV